MENISQRYAAVQLQLLGLEKAIVGYEDNAKQTVRDSQMLITIFTQVFDNFCTLISEYLILHHKDFAPGNSSQEVLKSAHNAGFISEHDLKILLQAATDKETQPYSSEEIPLIHNIEVYRETIQAIMREIKL